MNKVTADVQEARGGYQSGCLCGMLKEASVLLRGGEDAKGIEALLSAMSGLEKLVENDQNAPQPLVDLQRLLPALKSLHLYIKNKDIAGIADLLEDVFCPMTEEWMKGNDCV